MIKTLLFDFSEVILTFLKKPQLKASSKFTKKSSRRILIISKITLRFRGAVTVARARVAALTSLAHPHRDRGVAGVARLRCAGGTRSGVAAAVLVRPGAIGGRCWPSAQNCLTQTWAREKYFEFRREGLRQKPVRTGRRRAHEL